MNCIQLASNRGLFHGNGPTMFYLDGLRREGNEWADYCSVCSQERNHGGIFLGHRGKSVQAKELITKLGSC